MKGDAQNWMQNDPKARGSITTFRIIYSILGLLPESQSIFLIAFVNSHYPPNVYNILALFWHLPFPRIPLWN